jgi:GxxExxY protein
MNADDGKGFQGRVQACRGYGTDHPSVLHGVQHARLWLSRKSVCQSLLELKKLGLAVGHEVAIEVLYSGEVIGEYFADLIVNGVVIVEVKAARILAEQHESQLLNYLKASGFEVGLLLNFGPKAEIRRKAFDNALKGRLTWAAKP